MTVVLNQKCKEFLERCDILLYNEPYSVIEVHFPLLPKADFYSCTSIPSILFENVISGKVSKHTLLHENKYNRLKGHVYNSIAIKA